MNIYKHINVCLSFVLVEDLDFPVDPNDLKVEVKEEPLDLDSPVYPDGFQDVEVKDEPLESVSWCFNLGFHTVV